jgi:hypothetical protein
MPVIYTYVMSLHSKLISLKHACVYLNVFVNVLPKWKVMFQLHDYEAHFVAEISRGANR